MYQYTCSECQEVFETEYKLYPIDEESPCCNNCFKKLFDHTNINDQCHRYPESVKLARCILRAQQLREDSWNEGAEEYKLSMEGATQKACAVEDFESQAPIIHLLNSYNWNDAQIWAIDILRAKDIDFFVPEEVDE